MGDVPHDRRFEGRDLAANKGVPVSAPGNDPAMMFRAACDHLERAAALVEAAGRVDGRDGARAWSRDAARHLRAVAAGIGAVAFGRGGASKAT